MALQFKIQLKGISKPPVWRKVLVPKNFTFHDFHRVIQAAFGWQDYHLYQFSSQGWDSYPVIAIPSDDDWEKPDMNSEKTKLSKIFTEEKQTYSYIYDFGDNWEHKITLEKITDDNSSKTASCIGGKGACPPEDCGGTWGYGSFLDVISNPEDPEHDGMLEWAGLEEGETWEDVARFDLEEVNKAVQAV